MNFLFSISRCLSILGPLKDLHHGVSKLDSSPTFEEDMDTKADPSRLEFSARLGPVPFEFSSELSQLDWEMEKHTSFGVSLTLEMDPLPYWMSLVSMKHNNIAGSLKKSVFLVSICLGPSWIMTGNRLLDSKPRVGTLL